MSDDDWETDADYENNLTESEQRAFGNKETMEKYNAVMEKAGGGPAPGEAVLSGTPVKGLASNQRASAVDLSDNILPQSTAASAQVAAVKAATASPDKPQLLPRPLPPQPTLPTLPTQSSSASAAAPPPPPAPAPAYSSTGQREEEEEKDQVQGHARPRRWTAVELNIHQPPPPPRASVVSAPPAIIEEAPPPPASSSATTGASSTPLAAGGLPPRPRMLHHGNSTGGHGASFKTRGSVHGTGHGTGTAHGHGAVHHIVRRASDLGNKELHAVFKSFDTNSDGSIDMGELKLAIARLQLHVPDERLSALMAETDEDHDGVINFDEFERVVEQIKTVGTGQLHGGLATFETVVDHQVHHVMQQKEGNVVHSFDQEECAALVNFINSSDLGADPTLSYLLPIHQLTDLFVNSADGVLLCKLINAVQAETIDERVLNYRPSNRFLMTENLNLALNAAKAIGIKVVNIGPGDILDCRPHLVLGLVWQLVKACLLSKINLRANPNLIRLLHGGEELEQLMKLHPEKLLLRWINYHLAQCPGVSLQLDSLSGSSLCDSAAYLHLLSQVDPDRKASADLLRQTDDKIERAVAVVGHARRLGVDFIVQPSDIVNGNDKLNLAFVAALFNACPGLEPPVEQAQIDLLDELPEDDDDDAGDSREERAFRMWINSLALPDSATADGSGTCHNLFDDVRDGVLLLHVMDHMRSGVVEWKRVNQAPVKLVFKRIENLNYAVDLALKPPFGFSLVGVQGKDLADGNRKLTLALIWQMMRKDLTAFLASMRTARGGDHAASDAELVTWANEQVAASGCATRMRNFHDATLSDSLFLIDLLAAVEPRCIDRKMVTPGKTADEKALNAKYAISSARKLGCSLFCVWEDLVDVKPKMILSFVATVMGFKTSFV